ncbi:hypothetical protein BDR26DRAFT_854124 [Obelidium mucronatum]|nr:hypothetical protein BDR26DRAFT_854124 [Obelidium mucronatum]
MNGEVNFMDLLSRSSTYDSAELMDKNHLLNSPKKSVSLKPHSPHSLLKHVPKAKLLSEMKNFQGRMTPSQIMGSQISSLEDESVERPSSHFTHHRSVSSWDICNSPLFPQPFASPLAFSSSIPSIAPSMMSTPSLAAANHPTASGSSSLSATLASVQLNPTLFTQMLVSPALNPQPQATHLPPSSIIFSPSLPPASAWSSAGQEQYQQSLRKSPMLNGYFSPPSALGPNRLPNLQSLADHAVSLSSSSSSSFSSPSSSSATPLSSAAALEELKRKKLTPAEAKKTESSCRIGMLPKSILPEKSPSQQLILERVFDYLTDLQRQEQEKLQLIRDLEQEIAEAKLTQ